MGTFYTKNEAGDFQEADDKVEELFHAKSEKIVARKLAAEREKRDSQIRLEIEETVRKESLEKIESETREKVRAEFEAEFNPKLQESESKVKELTNSLRRKTIAAEYGFSADTEQFLGNGSEDEMRAKADILKKNFHSETPKILDKEDKNGVNPILEKTGLNIQI